MLAAPGSLSKRFRNSPTSSIRNDPECRRRSNSSWPSKTRMINLKRLGRLAEFKSDLKTASEIFRDYPHLTLEIEHFAEFFDTDAGGQK